MPRTRIPERIGDASGAQVGAYIMSRPEVKEAIAEVTKAAKAIQAVVEKVDVVTTPISDLAGKYDGEGGLIKALVEAVMGAMVTK